MVTARPGRWSVTPRRAARTPRPATVRVVVPGIRVFVAIPVPGAVAISVIVPRAPRSTARAARSPLVAAPARAQGQKGVLDLANGIRLTFRRHVCNYTFIVI